MVHICFHVGSGAFWIGCPARKPPLHGCASEIESNGGFVPGRSIVTAWRGAQLVPQAAFGGTRVRGAGDLEERLREEIWWPFRLPPK